MIVIVNESTLVITYCTACNCTKLLEHASIKITQRFYILTYLTINAPTELLEIGS